MTLSEEMLRYRAKENISQSEMAQRCHLTTQTICNIETGIQNPSRLTEMKIRLIIGKGKNEDVQA